MSVKKVSLDELNSIIVKKEFKTVEGTRLTICILYIEGGFAVTGESSTIDSTGYNQEIGEKIAFQNALNHLWELEGYFRVRFVDKIQKEFIDKDIECVSNLLQVHKNYSN